MNADIIDLRLAEATAAVRGLATDHSAAELRRRVELAEQQDWTCPWCGMRLFPSDIGAGQTDADHVIPLARGGPRELWNRELLHSKCNRSKGRQMTARAWELTRQYAVAVVPPDPAVVRRGVGAAASGLARANRELADFRAAGLEMPADAELLRLLADTHQGLAACAAALADSGVVAGLGGGDVHDGAVEDHHERGGSAGDNEEA